MENEIICMLEGELEMLMMIDGKEEIYPLWESQTLIIPAQVWHKARVEYPCRTLHITPWQTEHCQNF